MTPSIVLLDKPKGLSSFQVVEKLKKSFGLKKVGHAGTLDPIATGLLIALLEEATRFSEFFQRLPKTYLTTALFGVITDTYDAEGKVLEVREVGVNCEDVQRVLEGFVGRIFQEPPPFSAKKVKGLKAYQLARRGEKVELKPVEVEVYRAKTLRCEIPKVVFEFEVSAGTYIRSLVHDIGLRLGCGAHVLELRRTKIGDFSVSMALSYERLETIQDLWGVAIPIEQALNFLPAVKLSQREYKLFRNGAKIRAPGECFGYLRVFSEMGFVGVGLCEGGYLKPYRLMPL
ncbi:tRNA pseudouridine(55) synthase TruB [Thermocrinis sp.]